jgi:manganese/iron transport system permease protein
VRGLAFTGEAFAHAVFPGAVAASILGGSIVAGALACGLAAAVCVALIGTVRVLNEDAAVGVVFTGTFAVGALLLSSEASPSRDLESFLFGSLLGVSREDLLVTLAVAAVVLACLAVLWRPLVLASFDRAAAAAAGYRVGALDAALLVLLALTVVVAVQAIGNVLVLAMLVTPAATARLICRRLPSTAAAAAALGVSAGVIGLYASWYLEIAAGAAVVLAATAQLALVLLLSPRGVAGWLGRVRAAPATAE